MLPSGAAWTVVAVTILCRSALSTAVALLLWGLLPSLLGFETTTVMSASMAPRLQVGDAVVVRDVDAARLSPGQVLLFDDPDVPGRLRMHRMVRMEEDGRIVTRGDANPTPDSATTTVDGVHGAGFLRVPYAGLPSYWIRTGQVLPLAVSAAVAAVLLAGVRLGRLLEDPEDRARRRHRGVRVPALHRAAAATAALVVLAGGTAAAPGSASAALSATTRPAASGWQSACGDVGRTGLVGTPRFLWGYGSGTGTAVPDQSGQGAAGVLAGDAVRTTCTGGGSPFLSVGGGTGGGVLEQSARAYPGDTTIATWFTTSSAGGVLADFGSSAGVPASPLVDRALYMRADGALVFGGATVQALGLMGSPLLCSSPGGFADGRWHLAVATWSTATGCTLSIDGVLVDTARPLVAVSLLGYTGAWRFGYETLSPSTWTGATARGYFIGGLDESQVYGSVLSASAQAAILGRGR